MSKFVASTTEVSEAVNIFMEEFHKSIVTKGGLKSAIEYYIDQAATEFVDEKQIFIVNADLKNAETIAAALNTRYNELAEAGEEPTYTFAGTAGVAYGGEVVSANDTAEAAIANIESNKSNKQSKGEVKTMSTKTTNESIKNLVTAGVNDNDALAMAAKFQALKNQTKSEVKENVEMNNNRRGTGTVVKEEETQAQGTSFVFGGNNYNTNNGGNDMNTQTQTKVEEKKEQAPVNNNRRGTGYTGATAGATNNGPSFTFQGQTQDAVNYLNDGVGLTGFDSSDRDNDADNHFDGAWYFDAERYPALKDFDFYFENRRALPANPYGLTKINFLNPKDKKIVEYDNNYEVVVELCFGKGVNARIKLTRVTEAMKAQQVARGFKASKSEWSTGNIKWVERAGKLAPRYAFSVRNDLSLNVVCGCGKTHTVHTAFATTCKCGKKYDAVKMAPVGDSANLKFADRQSDWNPIVLDNFNMKVHKDLLALALACAAKERGMDVSAIKGGNK